MGKAKPKLAKLPQLCYDSEKKTRGGAAMFEGSYVALVTPF